MQLTKPKIHSELETLISFAQVLPKLLNAEVTIVICDKEKIIAHIKNSALDFGDIENKPLDEKDPMLGVLVNQKILELQVSQEVYGVAFRGVISPLYSKEGELLGTFSINTTLTNQIHLNNVAGSLTHSSEEMGASMVELASSAHHLNDSIDMLSSSQMEMYQQVESAAKMLDMINRIAKSTRILGLNAGIEAARSGEYGKGFAVVAKEITKLSDSSAASVEEIRQLMNSLKAHVLHVEKIVEKTSQISTHQSTSIGEMSDTVQALTNVAIQIENLAKKV